jgi:hypothetical protein
MGDAFVENNGVLVDRVPDAGRQVLRGDGLATIAGDADARGPDRLVAVAMDGKTIRQMAVRPPSTATVAPVT